MAQPWILSCKAALGFVLKVYRHHTFSLSPSSCLLCSSSSLVSFSVTEISCFSSGILLIDTNSLCKILHNEQQHNNKIREIDFTLNLSSKLILRLDECPLSPKLK